MSVARIAIAHRRRRRPRGLTLVELLLGLAGTGLVAAAMTAMLVAVSHGTGERTDLRKLVVKQKLVSARVTAAVRASRMVLAAQDDLLVLWVHDDDDSGAPNLSELRRIERDDATRRLRSFMAPATLDPADDVEYDPASTDFAATTEALRGTASFPESLWAGDVRAWAVSVNHADPQQATLVSYRVTLEVEPDGLADTAIAAAALRSD